VESVRSPRSMRTSRSGKRRASRAAWMRRHASSSDMPSLRTQNWNIDGHAASRWRRRSSTSTRWASSRASTARLWQQSDFRLSRSCASERSASFMRAFYTPNFPLPDAAWTRDRERKTSGRLALAKRRRHRNVGARALTGVDFRATAGPRAQDRVKPNLDRGARLIRPKQCGTPRSSAKRTHRAPPPPRAWRRPRSPPR